MRSFLFKYGCLRRKWIVNSEIKDELRTTALEEE